MPKPITPLVGCDVFVVNENEELLLIRRSDNGLWALPGGCNDLGESAKECAVRECFEETGYKIRITELIGVFSSTKYDYVYYPWRENEFCHLFFRAELEGGNSKTSSETSEVKWFKKDAVPPLSDGHLERVEFGWKKYDEPELQPYFE